MSGEPVCLQLDVGNSGGKWRLLRGAAVAARGRVVPDDGESRRALLACADAVDRIWVASVAAPEADAALEELLRQRWGVKPWFATTPARSGDLVNSYSEPSRMGVDRWLAMLGARARSPARLCVVDVGSALTIDLVAANGQHEGGYIIPGPQLMARSLQRDTQRVRYEGTDAAALDPGTATGSAAINGIALAQCGAVELALARAGDGEPLELFVTGGGGASLARLLERPETFYEDLVFEGLSIIGAMYAQG